MTMGKTNYQSLMNKLDKLEVELAKECVEAYNEPSYNALIKHYHFYTDCIHGKAHQQFRKLCADAKFGGFESSIFECDFNCKDIDQSKQSELYNRFYDLQITYEYLDGELIGYGTNKVDFDKHLLMVKAGLID